MSQSTVLSFSVPRNKQSWYWRSGTYLITADSWDSFSLPAFTHHLQAAMRTPQKQQKMASIYNARYSPKVDLWNHKISCLMYSTPKGFCKSGIAVQVKWTLFTVFPGKIISGTHVKGPIPASPGNMSFTGFLEREWYVFEMIFHRYKQKPYWTLFSDL